MRSSLFLRMDSMPRLQFELRTTPIQRALKDNQSLYGATTRLLQHQSASMPSDYLASALTQLTMILRNTRTIIPGIMITRSRLQHALMHSTAEPCYPGQSSCQITAINGVHGHQKAPCSITQFSTSYRIRPSIFRHIRQTPGSLSWRCIPDQLDTNTSCTAWYPTAKRVTRGTCCSIRLSPCNDRCHDETGYDTISSGLPLPISLQEACPDMRHSPVQPSGRSGLAVAAGRADSLDELLMAGRQSMLKAGYISSSHH